MTHNPCPVDGAPTPALTAMESEILTILERYMGELERGSAPDPQELFTAHPQHAARLGEYLASLAFLHEAAVSIRGGTQPLANDLGASDSAAGRLGDFRIVREVGRGGMGIVYEAEQLSLGRRVALKVLPFAAVLDARQLQRFKNEAQAAAHLRHSNIVHVYGVGCERGVHFYAMEFIDGQSLAQVIHELGEKTRRHGTDTPATSTVAGAANAPSPSRPGPEKLSHLTTIVMAGSTTEAGTETIERFRQIARITAQAADALDYAHEMGVVHRDIKPSNLLLDWSGNVWITDFGLARFQNDPGLTAPGDLPGTLRYMSPEQAMGNRSVLDNRTDIYSLGATLYELLTLKPIFAGQDRQELMRQIAHDEPLPPRRVIRTVPVELEIIALKALSKAPEFRYATARELADDLRRYLEHKPIHARPPSLGERGMKWVRRNRSLAVSAAVLLGLTAIGSSISTALVFIERAKALRERDFAREQQLLASERARALRLHVYVSDVKLAHQAWQRADFAGAMELLNHGAPQPGEDDLRGFEWHYVSRLCREKPAAWYRHARAAFVAAFSPDGKLLTTGGKDGIRVVEYPSGRVRATLTAHGDDVNGLAFSPDGKLLASAGDDGTIKLWDTADWKLQRSLDTSGGYVEVVAFAPDGKTLASAERANRRAGTQLGDDVVRLWNTETWQQTTTLREYAAAVQSLSFSTDGSKLALSNIDGTATIWDVATVQLIHVLRHPLHVKSVAFSHRGDWLATGCVDGRVCLWDARSGVQLDEIIPHVYDVESVAFSPDDRWLVSAGRDRTLRLWSVENSRLHEANVWRDDSPFWFAKFSDTDQFVTTSQDGSVKRWNRHESQEKATIPVPGTGVGSLAFAGAADSLAIASTSHSVETRELATGQVLRQFDAGTASCRIEISPHGVLAAKGEASGRLVLFDPSTGLERAAFTLGVTPIRGTHWSSTGDFVAAYNDTNVSVVDVQNGQVRSLSLASVQRLAFHPRDSKLAIATPGGLCVWDYVTGDMRSGLGGYYPIAFSADGRLLAVATAGNTILLLDTTSWAHRSTLIGHALRVSAAAFSPDGRTIASISDDGTLRLWNVATGRELLTLPTHATTALCVAFSPDGTLLASGTATSERGEVQVWSATREVNDHRATRETTYE